MAGVRSTSSLWRPQWTGVGDVDCTWYIFGIADRLLFYDSVFFRLLCRPPLLPLHNAIKQTPCTSDFTRRRDHTLSGCAHEFFAITAPCTLMCNVSSSRCCSGVTVTVQLPAVAIHVFAGSSDMGAASSPFRMNESSKLRSETRVQLHGAQLQSK